MSLQAGTLFSILFCLLKYKLRFSDKLRTQCCRLYNKSPFITSVDVWLQMTLLHCGIHYGDQGKTRHMGHVVHSKTLFRLAVQTIAAFAGSSLTDACTHLAFSVLPHGFDALLISYALFTDALGIQRCFLCLSYHVFQSPSAATEYFNSCDV